MDYIDANKLKFHERTWYTSENCELTDIVPAPIYGKISCGKFRFIDDNIEGYIEIPKSMIGDGSYFVLKASGMSMIDAGINDGDLIIVYKHSSPDNGQIAVVMVDGEVTLKRFYRLEKEQKYLLRPENINYKDIIVDHCEVLGIAVKIVKEIE